MKEKITWIVYYDVKYKHYNSLGVNEKGYCHETYMRPHADKPNLKDVIDLFDISISDDEYYPIVIKNFDFGITHFINDDRGMFDEDTLFYLLNNGKNIVHLESLDKIQEIDNYIKTTYTEYFNIRDYDLYSNGYCDSEKFMKAINEYKVKIGMIK